MLSEAGASPAAVTGHRVLRRKGEPITELVPPGVCD
jgi:hypothetical protein